MPLANDQSRAIDTKSAIALRKARNDFGISNEVTKDVEAAVSMWSELHGGPNGVDPDFELLYNRIDDIGCQVDNSIISINNVGRDISKVHQDNHSIINGINTLLQDTHSAMEEAIKANAFLDHTAKKQDSILSTIHDTLNATRNVTKDVRTLHTSSAS